VAFGAVDVSDVNAVTGALAILNGGTGAATAAGARTNLDVPSNAEAVLDTDLGTGVGTFLATPSSANLAAAVTNETGSGALVFATSPTLVTPLLGTPTSGDLQNCTGATTTTKGVVELTIDTEVTTGTSTTQAVTPDSLAGSTIFGVKAFSVYVVDGATALPAIGDGKAYMRVPAALNGMNIIRVAAQVIVKSTGGTLITVQVARGRQAAATSDFTYSDVLSTLCTIDNNEYDSKDAATAMVVNASNDDLATGDVLRIDLDQIGSGAKGLNVTIECQLP
jgi:hypothetical protein